MISDDISALDINPPKPQPGLVLVIDFQGYILDEEARKRMGHTVMGSRICQPKMCLFGIGLL